MTNRSIAVHTAFAFLLWPAGVILVCVGLFTVHELGQLGIVVCMVAATLNVRAFFCALENRERNAFSVGRDLGRSEAESIRSLR